MRLTHVALTRLGKKSSDTYGFIRNMAVIHLCMAAIILLIGLLNKDSAAAIIAGAVLFALPVIAVVLEVFARKVYRERTIGGVDYSPSDYAFIADELRGRGITNAERFIADNPEHQEAWKGLYGFVGRGDYEDITTYGKIRAFQSLIYSTEMDPHQAAEALKSIIAERKVTDPDSARELLRDYKSVGAPLGSGAL